MRAWSIGYTPQNTTAATATIMSALAHEDTDDAINDALKTLGTLQSMKGEVKSIGGDFYDDIEKIVEKLKKDIANRTGQLLHHFLRKDKPREETLKKFINQYPSCLERRNN